MTDQQTPVAPALDPVPPWWRSVWFWVCAVALVLAVLAATLGDGGEEGTAYQSPERPDDPTEPIDRGGSWGTSFVARFPPRTFVEGETASGFPTCKPMREDDYDLVTDDGLLVASADFGTAVDTDAGSLVFSRTRAEVSSLDGYCQVEVSVAGVAMSRTGDSYTLTDGRLSASLSAERLLSGQFDGVDSVATLGR